MASEYDGGQIPARLAYAGVPLSEIPDDGQRAEVAAAREADLRAADRGPTWTTDQLTADFEVTDFLAPFVFVTRKADGKRGSLEFTGSPRVYFNFQEV